VSTLLYKAWGAGIHPKLLQFDAHGLIKITSISLGCSKHRIAHILYNTDIRVCGIKHKVFRESGLELRVTIPGTKGFEG